MPQCPGEKRTVRVVCGRNSQCPELPVNGQSALLHFSPGFPTCSEKVETTGGNGDILNFWPSLGSQNELWDPAPSWWYGVSCLLGRAV